MSKEHKSVSEMLGSLTDDAEFKRQFEAELADKVVAKTLFVMRCAKGITQEQMAAHMSPSMVGTLGARSMMVCWVRWWCTPSSWIRKIPPMYTPRHLTASSNWKENELQSLYLRKPDG